MILSPELEFGYDYGKMDCLPPTGLDFDRFRLSNQFYDGFKCLAEVPVIQVVEGVLTF